jgi:nucleotidyltransferase substrate binding protein (TIGR01987 family)
MALDLSSLENALSSLDKALAFARKVATGKGFSPDEVKVIKAGVIQNFEFCYELCWKFMRRWLDLNHSESFTAGLSRKQLFRHAAESNLIADAGAWFMFHELRNKTSRTYDTAIAEEIFNQAADFHCHAAQFYHALSARND